MNLGEAWRLSKAPYRELAYRSAVMTRGTSGSLGRFRSPTAMVRSVMRGAMIGKIIIAAVVAFGVVFTFLQYSVDRTAANLVGAVTLSLTISLAYLVLYSLQVLPSFSAAGPYALLSTMPLTDRDLSLITVLTVARTFDYIAAATVLAEVAVVAYLTQSIPATGAMVLAGLANVVFGVAISIWLAGIFQRNMNRGGRGKGASVGRFLFLISWGLAAASIGFLFNLVNIILPILSSAVSGAFQSTAVPVFFSLVHPFSEALVVTKLVYPTFAAGSSSLGIASTLSFVSFGGYLVLAYLAGRVTLRTAAGVAHGQAVIVVRQRATEFLLRLRRPIPAYIFKDVRVASKNPSSAFIFALPVFEMLIIILTLRNVGAAIKALQILTTTGIGCFFALISASILLNTEGSGLEYTLTLPINARVVVLAKSLVATLAYLPVPAALGVFVALVAPSSVWLVTIPIIEAVAVSAATSAELSFFIQGYGRSGLRQTSRAIAPRGLNLMSAGDLVRFVGALLVAGGLVFAPLGVYGVTYSVISQSHLLALASMALVSLVEFVGVQLYLRRL